MLPDLAQTTAYVKPFDYSKQEKPTGCFDSAKKLQATRKLRHADENTDRYSKTSDILFGSESSGSSSSNSISSMTSHGRHPSKSGSQDENRISMGFDNIDCDSTPATDKPSVSSSSTTRKISFDLAEDDDDEPCSSGSKDSKSIRSLSSDSSDNVSIHV